MGHWRSWDFLTLLLRTLRMAVKDEQPSAQTTMNFHTDVSKTFHTLMFLKGHYEQAVADWAQHMDIISIDAYPNMYVSHPLNVQIIVDRIKKIQAIPAAQGKPIIVMETGYPMTNSSTPAIDPVLDFSEANGAEYILQSTKAIAEAGAQGLIYFKLDFSMGIQPPPGGFTQQDVEAMKMISKLYMDEHAADLIKWLFQSGNIEYLQKRMPALLAGIEKGWGLLNYNGTAQRGKTLDALKTAFTENA